MPHSCTAFKKATVFERLRNASARNVLSQYRRDFRANAMYKLRVSQAGIEQLIESTRRVLSAEDKSDAIVISGPAGAGKTRLGCEFLHALVDRSSGVVPDLEEEFGWSIVVVPLHIDFNNGYSFNADVDGEDMSENLGVRLAAAALGDQMQNIKTDNGGSLRGLNSAAVLDAMLAGVLRAEEENRASQRSSIAPDVVLLTIHFDEYQYYIKDYKARTKTADLSATSFKKMLSAVNDWAQSSGTLGQSQEALNHSLARTSTKGEPVTPCSPQAAFLPIVSGTPVAGVGFEVTDKLLEVPVPPGRFDFLSAAELVADVMTQSPRARPPLAGFRKAVLEMLTSQEEACSALSDTDFRPRYLVYLGVAARRQLAQTWSTSRDIYTVNWGVAVNDVLRRVSKPKAGRYCEQLVLLALSQLHVRLVPVESQEELTGAESSVQQAGKVGDVELCDTGEADMVTVRMPLVQLRKWGLASSLPPSLVDMSVFSWAEVELLVAYCLRAKLYPNLGSQPLTAQGLFPGALGLEHLPELLLQSGRKGIKRDVYTEVSQFTSPSKPVPKKVMMVEARSRGSSDRERFVHLCDGVFLTCPGTMAVDVRFSVPLQGKAHSALHVVVQTKRSSKATKTSAREIRDWYESVFGITELWRTNGDELLYVYVTNRKLSDKALDELNAAFFRARPFLIVVSSDQLGSVVPPFLTSRVLTPVQQVRDDEAAP